MLNRLQQPIDYDTNNHNQRFDKLNSVLILLEFKCTFRGVFKVYCIYVVDMMKINIPSLDTATTTTYKRMNAFALKKKKFYRADL